MMKLDIQRFADGKIVIGTEVDTSGVEKGLKETDAILQKNNNKTKEIEDAQRRIAEAQERIKQAQEESKQAEERIAQSKQVTLKYTEEIAQIEERDDNLTKQLIKYGEIDAKLENIGNSIKKVTKSVVKWSLTLIGLSGVFSFIKSSISTISQQDKELANDINYIKTALAYSLEPVVRVIVNLMKQLLILIGGVVKMLTGRNIFAETNKGLANANKQAKTLSKQLAGFDEMNVLSDTSSSGGGVDTQGFDPTVVDNMSVEIDKIIGKWKQFGKEMKQAIDLPLSDWFDGFGEWGLAMAGVTQYVYGLWEIVDGFFGFLKGGLDIIVGLITSNEELIKKGIVELLDGLWKIIDGFLNMIVGNIKIVLGVILGIVVNLVKIVWENIVSAFKLGLSIIQGIFTTLIGVLKAPFVILWETAQTVFNSVVGIIRGIFNVIKNLFTGDIKGVMNSFKQIFKSTFDALWGIVKAPINLIIEGINALIKGINKISFDVPDWVPIIGGQKWGFKIPKIPKLAKGGIVNNPGPGVMMGSYIAGERGPEAVIPLDDDTLDRLGLAFARHTQINATVPVYVGNRQIAREIRKIEAENDFAFNV